jgi:hypothetical protein
MLRIGSAILVLALSATAGCAPRHETLLRQADATSDPAAALKVYVAALQAVPAGDATGAEFEIRKKAIACARKMTPPPALPADAQQHFVGAAVILNDSKDELARQKAAAEFAACLKSAPWHADAYYNLAALQEVAKDNDAALANYQLYLLANPGADNAKAVQAKVAALELQRKKSGIGALEGIWRQHLWNNEPSPYKNKFHYLLEVRGKTVFAYYILDQDDPMAGTLKGDKRETYRFGLIGRRIEGVMLNPHRPPLRGTISEDFNEIFFTYPLLGLTSTDGSQPSFCETVRRADN